MILEPNASICVFQDPGNICLFNDQNNKILFSVGLLAHKMYLLRLVFDTGAGPNLIRADFLQTEWFNDIQAIGQSSLQSETGQGSSSSEPSYSRFK